MEKRSVENLIAEYDKNEQEILVEENRKKLRIERIEEEIKEIGYVPEHNPIEKDYLGNKSPEEILVEAKKELEEFQATKEERSAENLNVLIQELQKFQGDLKKEIIELKKAILQNEMDLEESRTSRDSTPEKVSDLMKKSEELETLLENKCAELEKCREEIEKKLEKRVDKRRMHKTIEMFHEGSDEQEIETSEVEELKVIKPEKTKPEETKPEEPQITNTETEKKQPEKEIEDIDLNQTESKVEENKVKQEEVKIEDIDLNQTESNNIKSGRKPEISRILICPITNTISYELIDEKGIYGVGTEELNYTKDFVKGEYVKELLEDEKFDLSEEQIEDIIGKVDPNILKVLEENDKEALNKYINSIANSEDIPFDIEYDLKDMYKTDMLYNKEKTNLLKIAKKSEKLGAKISKDNIFKRTFNRLKSLINKQTRKALVEDNKTYGKVWEEYNSEELDSKEENSKDTEKEKNLEEKDGAEKYKPRHVKEKYEPKHLKKKKNILSKSKSIAASIGKKAVYKCKTKGKDVINRVKDVKLVKAVKSATQAFKDSYKAEVNPEEVLKKDQEVEIQDKEEDREI